MRNDAQLQLSTCFALKFQFFSKRTKHLKLQTGRFLSLLETFECQLVLSVKLLNEPFQHQIFDRTFVYI